MLNLLLNFPAQIEEAMEIAKKIELPSAADSIDNIVYCGMGGSAISGDFLKNLLRDELIVPMEIVRNYTIPSFVNERTLLISASYSGNTEETLFCLKSGIERSTHLIGITSGGELAGIFNKLSTEERKIMYCIRVPGGFPPRTAFGYMFVPIWFSLYKIGLTLSDPVNGLKDAIKQLRTVSDEFNPENKLENRAYTLAKEIYGTISVIYGSADSTSMVAQRWTTQFSENAKILSYYNAIPEMNHNEIVGWENLSDIIKRISVVFLKDRDDSGRVALRQQITKKLLEKGMGGNPYPAKIIELQSEGSSRLARLLFLIYLGDFVSWYLAILYSTDPTPVKRIDTLKKYLAESK